ncbi:hypothetical protein TBLA_0I01230 [Henningerozyma blattae CBS 6284]|uniref:DNA replication regulator SLD2 n=1 Tax=Henningerozyma blattae (strain ATCC 34711 / CBS 6284 / DSM 70876 / NBRC 10599 / NRRL Y-10934 / UCD 77-7) TaxID=1071380 RepID=I2H8T1_HENB6|nr:hypothetical protein TBLA_0I01230 [Tetrapisispora blattae CBS 6284]CCH62783.1 hypothetical protein TBLA_0I01230 [Tetrapisispora blattae CBS 6284]
MTIQSVKLSIKNWEHGFIETNKRPPKKEDLKKYPEIKRLYKKYALLKREQSNIDSTIKQLNTHKSPEKRQVVSISKTPITKEVRSAFELGPTPQIYGKSVSIFEMNISPMQNSLANPSIDKDIPSLPPIKRKLTFEMTPNSSPQKEDIIDTKPTIQHQRPKSMPFSPLKLEENNIQLLIRKTPLKPSDLSNRLLNSKISNISESPSPLIKRPIARSIYELDRETKSIANEFNELKKNSLDEDFITSNKVRDIFTEEKNDVNIHNTDNDEINEEDENTTVQQKNKTQKTKGRRLIRRLEFPENSEAAAKVPKDLHRELYKIKKKRVKEFLGKEHKQASNGMETETESEDSTEEDIEEDIVEQKITTKKKRPKKYNLVSNNFRRLKLRKKANFRNRGRR